VLLNFVRTLKVNLCATTKSLTSCQNFFLDKSAIAFKERLLSGYTLQSCGAKDPTRISAAIPLAEVRQEILDIRFEI